MTESEIERLRAQVDTLTRQRDELRHIKAQFVALTDDGGSVDVTSFMVELHARAESAEARITALEAAIRPYGRLASIPTSVIRAALREPVGEHQPEPCTTCGGTGTITVPDHSDECYRWQECVGDCPVAIPAPCPSCVPPTTESEQR